MLHDVMLLAANKTSEMFRGTLNRFPHPEREAGHRHRRCQRHKKATNGRSAASSMVMVRLLLHIFLDFIGLM